MFLTVFKHFAEHCTTLPVITITWLVIPVAVGPHMSFLIFYYKWNLNMILEFFKTS